MQPTNAILIQGDSVIKTWLRVLEPLHHLTQKEQEVASMFIETYINNKQFITNDDKINSATLSTESKKKIRLSLDLTPTYFQIILRGLRDKEFILDNKINKKYIPSFNKNGNIILAYIIKDK